MEFSYGYVMDPRMAWDKDVVLKCREMVSALTVAMNPEVDERFRQHWQQVCEAFKENYPLCLSCALMLSQNTEPAMARLYGLQIMEHVVKFRWMTMPYNEREFLKSRIIAMITMGTLPILQEDPQIKDAIAKVVVEIIKHDWPQRWMNMLLEMDRLSMKGEIQAELTMLILMKLGEEVKRVETLTMERIGEIKLSLVQKNNQILSFLLRILQSHGIRYNRLKAIEGLESMGAKSSCLAMVAALKTLAVYFDWMTLWQITYKDYRLLESLWTLLNEQEMQLQVHAADCLLAVINRLGNLKANSDLLMVLYGNEAMMFILSAVQNADGKWLAVKRYSVLKKLCQVVCSLGLMLCSSVDSDAAIPSTFGNYLDTLIKLTTHPSHYLCSSTQSVWRAFFNHAVLSRNYLLLGMLPRYRSATLTNLEKVGFPSQNDSPRCEYSHFDFINDENFAAFLTTYHDELRETMMAACQLDPRPCFQMAYEWLKSLLSTPVDTGPIYFITVIGRSYATSPFFIQLDAATHFFEMISPIFQNQLKEDIPVNEGVELLKLVLDMETSDPLLLYYVVANIFTLCPFLKYRNDYWPQVLTKTLKVIEAIEAPRETFQKIVRKNACSSFTKMCQDNAPIFLPNFETLYSHVKELLSNSQLLLTQNEMCSLMEGLILISNRFKDYERQKAFLEELVLPVASFLLSEKTLGVLTDPKSFVQYVGADIQMSDTVVEDLTVLNSSRISYCISTIQIVLRWSRCPSTLKEAKDGGFVTAYMPSGMPIYRNPCTEQVLKLLNIILDLTRTQHNLFLPENVSKMSSSFYKAMNFQERKTSSVIDRPHRLMDIHSNPVNETELERMQSFFCSLYEDCLCILGLAGPSLMQDFYSMADLTKKLLNSAFVNLENISSYRICILLRECVKPLVLNCPAEYYETLVTPILGPFLTLLHGRLTNEWHFISRKTILNTEDAAEIKESEIMLLTREVIGFIVACCMPIYEGDTSRVISESGADEMMKPDKPQPPPTLTNLSELGVCLMKNETVRSALLVTVFTSLAWKDNSNSYKSVTRLCWPLLSQVISEPLIESAVTYFFTMVLKALEDHDGDIAHIDSLVNLAFEIYASLRLRYSDLKKVIKDIPGIMEKSRYFEKFDNDILEIARKQDSETRRYSLKGQKEHFENLLHGYFKIPLNEMRILGININNPTPSRKPSRQHSSPSRNLSDHSPLSVKPGDHALSSATSEDEPPPCVTSEDDPPPSVIPEALTPPVKPKDNLPSSDMSQDHSRAASTYEDNSHPFVTSEDDPLPSVTSTYHPPPYLIKEDCLPPSIKPKEPSLPSWKPGYLLLSDHHFPPSSEWTTQEPAKDEPMVSMEDDSD